MYFLLLLYRATEYWSVMLNVIWHHLIRQLHLHDNTLRISDARTGLGPETFAAAHCDSLWRTRHMHRKNIHVRGSTVVRADAALVRTNLLYVSVRE